MQMGFEIGADNYRKYFDAFGYFEKSGIDISGESITKKGVTFWDDELFESADIYLATASFGQNFKISPIAHLTAITAVANGGNLLTPHFIKEITDGDGNVIYTYEPKVRRQVISEETSKEVSKVLADGVATDGGSKNAYIAGYRIAAKTGTSEKKDEKSTDYEKYVCSAIAYAPYEAPKLSAIILVDEPTEGVLYASVIAAPYIGALMEEILPYYGVAAEYTEEELKTQTITAPALVQGRVAFVKGFAESLGFEVEVVGDGEYVKAQSPATGEEVEPGSAKLILYTTDEAVKTQKQIKVPDLVGMTAVAANGTLINNGLNIKISGAKNYMYGKGAIVVEQSPAAGEYVKEGSVVNITLRYMDAVD
jgi:stage V sporulation protein D (sporulation-specific penicillin-binding protein)